MKKLLLNGLAVGIILGAMSIMLITERAPILTPAWRRLIDILVVIVMYGLLWVWVNYWDAANVPQMTPIIYHIQTWSSSEQIESFLDQSSSQLSYINPSELHEELDKSERSRHK
jgi:hypothetical protein